MTIEQPFLDLRDQASPDVLRVIAVGSAKVVENYIMVQHQLGYAEPFEWSRPLPTINPKEIMRILTKRISLMD
jgi:hypothetical protein